MEERLPCPKRAFASPVTTGWGREARNTRLGTALRMLPKDFCTKKEYGLSVDWPISYSDLSRYYEMAEYEIGVSGDVSEHGEYGRRLFPIRLRAPYLEKIPRAT